MSKERSNSVIKDVVFLVRAKGGLGTFFNRMMEVEKRYGLVDTKKCRGFCQGVIDIASPLGVPITIMVSTGHLASHRDLVEFFQEKAQVLGDDKFEVGDHNMIHAPPSDDVFKEIEFMNASAELLRKSGFDKVVSYRAPRYKDLPGTYGEMVKRRYKLDASGVIWFTPEVYRNLPEELSDNLEVSYRLSGNPPKVESQISIPEIHFFEEGELVKVRTTAPDDEMENSRCKSVDQRADEVLKIMWEMADYFEGNMELFVQQFHLESYELYGKLLKEFLAEYSKHDVHFLTFKNLAEWWIERDKIRFKVEGDSVVVSGTERGRLIVIKPGEKPADQEAILGYRKLKMPTDCFPGIGLKGSPENVSKARDFFSPDFLVENDIGGQHAFTFNADDVDPDKYVKAIREITAGKVEHQIFMRSRWATHPEDSGRVFKSAYVLSGDICKVTVKEAVEDILFRPRVLSSLMRKANKIEKVKSNKR